MLDTFQGLPVHALVVHATVVMLPTAAILTALAAVYPRFRSWIGPTPAIAAVISVILVPLSTSSGDKLKDRIDVGSQCRGVHEAIEHHEELADWLLWLVIPLAILAIVGYLVHKRGGKVNTAVVAVVAALSVLSAGTVLVQVARVGHAGAEATWKAQC